VTTAVAYFEDVTVASSHETPALTLTEAHVAIYLGLTRELPDDTALVPDLLPLCFTPGLGWRAPTPPLAVMAFMGLDWQVLRPVRVGDTIHSRARVVTKRPLREGGVVIEEREVIDQRGDVVQQGRFTYLVARRPKEAAV
jgi:3-hydroxybutyryl-CoA dehydratase